MAAVWEINAFHNSESLGTIFNATAAILASGDYTGALAAVAICGFFAAMVAYMFQPQKLQGWKWLGSVVLVYGCLILPRVTVGVVDRTGGAPTQIIDNVPFGMAALGSITSNVGYTLSSLFETAYQLIPDRGGLPPELGYQQGGLMFGSRIIQTVRGASIPDPGVRADLLSFVNNCTQYDLSDPNGISAGDFMQSDNLWLTMRNTNPARFTTIYVGNSIQVATCSDAYDRIDARLPAQVEVLSKFLGQKLNPSISQTAARAAVTSQIQQSYARAEIAGAAADAAAIIRQNALINAINDAEDMGCQSTQDPACMMLSTSRASAIAAQNSSWINGAKIAEQSLPILRNAAESIIYGVFPIVILLLFLSSGKTTLTVLGAYLTALISIQLWPPLFSILNYVASVHAHMDQAAAATLSSGAKALSLQTAPTIYSNAVSAQAVVSGLVLLIPALAYTLANRLSNFGSALVTSSAQQVQSTATSFSSSAANGNVSMGMTSMDQINVAPTRSNAFQSTITDSNGMARTLNSSGMSTVAMPRSSGAIGNQLSISRSASEATEATHSAESAKKEAVSAGMERAAAIVDAIAFATTHTRGFKNSDGTSLQGSDETGQMARHLASMLTGRDEGITMSDRQEAALRVAGSLGLSVPGAGVGGGSIPNGTDPRQGQLFGAPPEQKAPFRSPLKAGLMLDAGNTNATSLGTSDGVSRKSSFGSGAELLQRFVDRFSKDKGYVNESGASDSDRDEIAARLATTTKRSQMAESAYQERAAYAEKASTEYRNSLSGSIDSAAMPRDITKGYTVGLMESVYSAWMQHEGNPQAQTAAVTGIFASTGLPPTPGMIDTSHLPRSSSQVLEQHNDNLRDPKLAPKAVDAANAANRDRVHPGGKPRVRVGRKPVAEPRPLDSVRSEVKDAYTDTQQLAQGSHNRFYKKQQIVQTPSGATTTERSLHGNNVRNARAAIGATGNAVARDFDKAADKARSDAAQRQKDWEQQSGDAAAKRDTTEIPSGWKPSSGKRK